MHSQDMDQDMDQTCPCPGPGPCCIIQIPGISAPPQASFFVRFLHFAKWIPFVWGGTVYLLVLMEAKIQKDHQNAQYLENIQGLCVALLVLSILCGVYLMCLYVHATEDPERYCWVNFTSVLLYDAGVVAPIVLIVTLFVHHKLWVYITFGIGMAILVISILMHSCRVIPASNAVPNHAHPPSSAAPSPPSSAAPSSVASHPPSPAAVHHSTGPVGIHYEWCPHLESNCDYLSETQLQGFDAMTTCFGSGN